MSRLVLPIARRSPGGQAQWDTVVFLDVDGVLHSLYGEDLFRDSCCSTLARIVKAAKAVLVLSSTWRTEPGKVAILDAILQRWQVGAVVDKTKDLGDEPREVEICEWLDRHPEVGRWIAIDDMDLQASSTTAAARMHGHFVRTDAHTGLVAKDADSAIQLLLAQSAGPTPVSSPCCGREALSPQPGVSARRPQLTLALPTAAGASPTTPCVGDFFSPMASPMASPLRSPVRRPRSTRIGGMAQAVDAVASLPAASSSLQQGVRWLAPPVSWRPPDDSPSSRTSPGGAREDWASPMSSAAGLCSPRLSLGSGATSGRAAQFNTPWLSPPAVVGGAGAPSPACSGGVPSTREAGSPALTLRRPRLNFPSPHSPTRCCMEVGSRGSAALARHRLGEGTPVG
mmetsp:Transcript_51862/g.150934  ORF Transcript_51862/g.150934 Transcript_51862/m.150934 type:complete len:398 (+) Transcript_51862:67-1260(+)|eukprot:CAMPEP_0170239360 /NCGR_PEP_ID=MMETSP0116_2-20130129/19437_1 /TAXON_ID=400756 /ORGANISM="Durinskia baltica, Strain CSIRO CS-38" /LENGTH=397 /DNA_ID=CAMNT_0010490177 /DNA_START=59 /DNA_END=1252 /DNA_ORIENTATION=-